MLDPAKAKRMGAATMYIPSPEDIRIAILEIPRGETRTLLDIRRHLAIQNHADITCPSATTKYWKWVAGAAAEDPSDPVFGSVPYWRVLKDGKLSPYLPGGVLEQQRLLDLERVGV